MSRRLVVMLGVGAALALSLWVVLPHHEPARHSTDRRSTESTADSQPAPSVPVRVSTSTIQTRTTDAPEPSLTDHAGDAGARQEPTAGTAGRTDEADNSTFGRPEDDVAEGTEIPGDAGAGPERPAQVKPPTALPANAEPEGMPPGWRETLIANTTGLPRATQEEREYRDQFLRVMRDSPARSAVHECVRMAMELRDLQYALVVLELEFTRDHEEDRVEIIAVHTDNLMLEETDCILEDTSDLGSLPFPPWLQEGQTHTITFPGMVGRVP